jgi:hypothetical protein
MENEESYQDKVFSVLHYGHL